MWCFENIVVSLNFNVAEHPQTASAAIDDRLLPPRID